jgi:hypothetical protein
VLAAFRRHVTFTAGPGNSAEMVQIGRARLWAIQSSYGTGVSGHPTTREVERYTQFVRYRAGSVRRKP